MAVSDPSLLDVYADIATSAYENDTSTPFAFSVNGNGGTYSEILAQVNGPFGFQARAFSTQLVMSSSSVSQAQKA